MSEYTNPYGVSYIQTAAGAVITGEIKRYDTYKDMFHDAQVGATRLASVANASHDEDFDVPADHVGGVLYQRDTIGNTWILLYSEKDLAVPTYVNWNHILDVPKWVGGITHNRKKLTEDTVAELRTTYYSFGTFNLFIPRADLKRTIRKERRDGTIQIESEYAFDLGEEIVLEQYETPIDVERDQQTDYITDIKQNVGAMIIPYEEGDILTETASVMELPENSGNFYQVIFTYAPATVRTNGQDNQVITHAYSFKLICTEDDSGGPYQDSGKRYWVLQTADDQSVEAIRMLREEQTNHLLAEDPHNQYVKKIDLRHYLVPASRNNTGVISLAVRADIDANNDRRAVTPYLLKNYVNEAINYKYNVLHNEIQAHVNNTSIHITVGEKQKIQDHLDDSAAHVSADDRIRWDSNSGGSGGGSEPGDVAQHDADPDAHYDLFISKQHVLEPGNWITITPAALLGNPDRISCVLKSGTNIIINADTTSENYGKISCTLTGGTYISVFGNQINCMLKPGSGISFVEDTDHPGEFFVNNTNNVISHATEEDDGIVKIVTTETYATNSSNDTDAVTPAVLTNSISNILNATTPINISGLMSLLPDMDAFVRVTGSDGNATTTKDKIFLEQSNLTCGCLLFPFTYALNSRPYNLVLEWGMTEAFDQTVNANTWLYLMINKPGYYRLKKIIFANTRCFHTSFPYSGKEVWQKTHEEAGNADARIVSPVSFKQEVIDNPDLTYCQDGIASLLTLFDLFKNTYKNHLMIHWFVIGLANSSEVWPNCPVWDESATETDIINYKTNVTGTDKTVGGWLRQVSVRVPTLRTGKGTASSPYVFNTLYTR